MRPTALQLFVMDNLTVNGSSVCPSHTRHHLVVTFRRAADGEVEKMQFCIPAMTSFAYRSIYDFLERFNTCDKSEYAPVAVEVDWRRAMAKWHLGEDWETFIYPIRALIDEPH